jgi:predicted nucleic acid-binding protein
LIVIDASAVMELLLNARGVGVIVSYMGAGVRALAAPHLIDLEVAHVLRRHIRGKSMTHARAQEALADWREFPVGRFPHDDLLGRILELRDNATAYDAAYIALAEALNAPLLTHDAKLRTIPGHKAQIILM